MAAAEGGVMAEGERFPVRILAEAPVIAITLFVNLLSSFSLIAAAQTVRAPSRITEPLDVSKLVRLPGNTHPLARPEYDRGPAPDGLPMDRMLLVLKRGPEQEAQLGKLLTNQQVKSSPQYHHWLTPEEFGQQFGVDNADIQTVTNWLTSEGLQVDRVSAGRTIIEFSGNAGLVRAAFGADIHKYVVNGRAYWANSRDPEIPAALAPVVAGMASLNNFPVKRSSRPIGLFSRSKATGKITPLFSFTTASGTFHALGPTDFGTIYNLLPLWNSGTKGAGEMIAIIAQSNINIQDARDFRSLFGLPANDPHIILNGPDPGIVVGDEGESDLDVEWAGAVAPQAAIDLVVSESTMDGPGINLSALYAVDNNIAPILSMSYGACELSLGVAGNEFYSTLWEQAAAQGITVIIASGDVGSAGCETPGEPAALGGLGVSGAASTPFDVAVGGADFDIANAPPAQYWSGTNDSVTHASALSYIPETTWNDSCAEGGVSACTSASPDNLFNVVAAGGGPSTCGVLQGADPNSTCVKGYPKPAWQTGAGVPNDGVRDVPDISLFSGDGKNGSFYIVCQADENPNPNSTSCDLKSPYEDFVGTGGTSTSAQTYAGIMALVDQKTGARQGNANYVLYKLAAQKGASCPSTANAASDASCIFYDVVTGNNSVACQLKSPDCNPSQTTGYGILMSPGSNPVAAWMAGPGYDLATGLGSINVANLVNNWSSVSFAPTETKLSLSPTTITHGQPVSVTINVTSQSPGMPTGAVALLGGPGNNPSGIADFTLNNGNATGTTISLPGGTYSVTASYAGDGNFGSSTSSPPIQITVNKETSQTQVGIVSFDSSGNMSSSNAATVAYGSPYLLRVSVTNAAGASCGQNDLPVYNCPTGTINLTDNGAPLDLGAYSLNSLGALEDQLIQLPPGSHSIVATYSGDNSFSNSKSNPDPVSVTKAATTTSLTANTTSVSAGSSVILTAVVSTQSSGVAPSGTVQFMNGSTPISGQVTYAPTDGFSITTAQLQALLSAVLPSTAKISATYAGDSNYTSSVSAPVTITITPGFAVSADPASVTIASPGQSATSALTVTPGGGFTGTINLSCSVPSTMTGASCSISPSSLTTSGSATLTVVTTAAQAGMALFQFPDWFLGGGCALLACLALLSLIDRRRLRLAFAMALILLVATCIGCGGGGQQGASAPPPIPGTPAGTYAVTVTAATATASISHTASVSVKVE